MPRPRIKVWQIMIAVAAMAVVIVFAKHWSHCMSRADWHTRLETNRREGLRWMLGSYLLIASNLAVSDANKHAQLKTAYERAAWMPWEPLPSDRFVGEPDVVSSFEIKNP